MVVTYWESRDLGVHFCEWPLFCLHYYYRIFIHKMCITEIGSLMYPLGIFKSSKLWKPCIVAYQMYTLNFLSRSLAKNNSALNFLNMCFVSLTSHFCVFNRKFPKYLALMEVHQKFLISVRIVELSAFPSSNYVVWGGLGEKDLKHRDSVDEQGHAHVHSLSSKSIFTTCGLSTFFLNFCFWERERKRENKWGRGRERGRHRIERRLQALSCQHRQSLTGGSNPWTGRS